MQTCQRGIGPGLRGLFRALTCPLEPEDAQDRYITLGIRFDAKPRANDVAFDNAFHAVCSAHQTDMQRAARKLIARPDWRAKIVFAWPVASANGVTVMQNQSQYRWLSNCRPAT